MNEVIRAKGTCIWQSSSLLVELNSYIVRKAPSLILMDMTIPVRLPLKISNRVGLRL